MKIKIEEFYDGFAIILIDPHNKETQYHFDQEDTHRNLVDVFYALGYRNVSYEEIC